MRRLAVIPARGGSKRIKNKNIKDFLGRPILTYPLNSIIESKLFDHIHVSTDCRAIAEVASDLNCKPNFLRDSRMSDDITPVFDVVREVVMQFENLGTVFDQICLVYATAVFLTPEDLIKAFRKFEEDPHRRAILSVAKLPASIERTFKLDEAGNLCLNFVSNKDTRSQDLKPSYYDAAMFAIYSRQKIITSNKEFRFQPYEIPQQRALDIDWPEDWARAEEAYKRLGLLNTRK